MTFNNRAIYEIVCGPNNLVLEYPSSSRLGTAYGKFLAEVFAYHPVGDPYCDPYCIYDWWIVYKDRRRATFFQLAITGNDPTVFEALVSGDDPKWRYPNRVDIIDAERYHVYEIKPISSRNDGAKQLTEYLSALNTTANRIVSSDLYRPDLRDSTRVWHGGTWDPTPYPFVVPGKPGEFCMIYAQQDAQVPGLILYGIACCTKPSDDEAEAKALIKPELVSLSGPLEQTRPKFERMMHSHLPFVPPGREYAFLIPERAFIVVVAGPEASAQDQMLQRAWDMLIPPAFRLDSTNQRRLLELYVLGFTLFPLATDAVFLATGYMRSEDILPKYELALNVVKDIGLVVAVVGAIMAFPEDLPAVAAVAPEIEAETILAEYTAEMAVNDNVEVEILKKVASYMPALPPLVTTETILPNVSRGDAIASSDSAIPWCEAPPGNPDSDFAYKRGLGVVGLISTSILTAEQVSKSLETGSKIDKLDAQPLGCDEIYLVPLEFLRSENKEYKLGGKVEFGGANYVIAGLVKGK